KPVQTSGNSMSPTLKDGDRAIASLLNYTPAYGDVVIIKDLHKENKYIVKRIIGLAEDIINIDFSTGEVTRNGEIIDEPYLTEPTTMRGDIVFPLIVPQYHAFVMGDNRNNSTDSRTSYTGMIPMENIKGKVLLRFYPPQNFGKVK
ncbi:MAG: signal peptidase I, partial [Angelakisella sp.]